MSDFCSMCMKPGTYSGFILQKDSDLEHILDGSYCNEHMIVKLKQIVEFLQQRHSIVVE